MLPIGVLAFFARDMALGKTGYANGKIPLLTNEFDQLAGELESSRSEWKFAAARRVAA